ncbi:hypothetical protein [Microlunatus parietis]|uniref:Uncharacterized protein n=1 Tax=Microlunatus parietis TaxID=682979 RepID=A0A7Y9I3V3_9ACTN|nr:hypothetical protein [Microlunatus parietis]NYE69757.1 hypothetical protein [Microlunatus parietis]
MTRRLTAGMPIVALIGLALLAVPRVVLHDLGIIEEGTFVNLLFVFVPPVIWIVVVLTRRVPNPFLTLLIIGALYGVFLAITHQLLWDLSWAGSPPTLGGNLSTLPPAAHAAITRGFAVISSLLTGLIVGAVTGLAGWLISRISGRIRMNRVR